MRKFLVIGFVVVWSCDLCAHAATPDVKASAKVSQTATAQTATAQTDKSQDDEYDENGRHWLDEFEEEELDTPYITPTLRAGSRDKTSVRAAQYLLRSQGYKIAVDGVFGAQTTAVVRRFRAAKKLPAGSVVDEGVWSWLLVTVKRGSKNPNAVRALQSLLRARGFRVALDGVFGQETQTAVRRFQVSRGLHDDNLVMAGVVDYVTWSALLDGRILDL